MKCQLGFLEEENYGWVGIIKKWMENDRVFNSGTYYQHEMIFSDLNVRGIWQFRQRDFKQMR